MTARAESASRSKPPQKRRQSPGKSPEVQLVPQSHGGALRNGSARGNTPGTGRPPDEFKRMLSHLVSRDQTMKELKAILEDRDHPHYVKALQFAADRGYPELASALRTAKVELTQHEPLKIVHEHVLVEAGPRGQHIRPLDPLEVKQLGP